MKSMQLLCLLAALLLTGCKDGKKPTGTQDTATGDTIETATAADATAAQPGAVWMGRYTGTLPCWNDCDGLKTEIEVRTDSTYTLSSQALGQEDKP